MGELTPLDQFDDRVTLGLELAWNANNLFNEYVADGIENPTQQPEFLKRSMAAGELIGGEVVLDCPTLIGDVSVDDMRLGEALPAVADLSVAERQPVLEKIQATILEKMGDGRSAGRLIDSVARHHSIANVGDVSYALAQLMGGTVHETSDGFIRPVGLKRAG